jgi:hypothetical protein
VESLIATKPQELRPGGGVAPGRRRVQ